MHAKSVETPEKQSAGGILVGLVQLVSKLAAASQFLDAGVWKLA